jgi:hypothetical protein
MMAMNRLRHLLAALLLVSTTTLSANSRLDFSLLDAGCQRTAAYVGDELQQSSSGCSDTTAAECFVAAGTANEGIYEFTSASGKTYVGQSGDIATRLNQHLGTGKLLPGDLSTVQATEVLGGKTAREIAEQLRINELGGVQNLENIRNPIGPARQYLLPPNPHP